MILSYFIFCFSITYVGVWALIEIDFYLGRPLDISTKMWLTNPREFDNL